MAFSLSEDSASALTSGSTSSSPDLKGTTIAADSHTTLRESPQPKTGSDEEYSKDVDATSRNGHAFLTSAYASTSSSPDLKGKSISKGSQTTRQSHEPESIGDEGQSKDVDAADASRNGHAFSPRAESDLDTTAPIEAEVEKESSTSSFGAQLTRLLRWASSDSLSGSDIGSMSQSSSDDSGSDDDQETSTSRRARRTVDDKPEIPKRSARVSSNTNGHARLETLPIDRQTSPQPESKDKAPRRSRPSNRPKLEAPKLRRRVVYRSQRKYQEIGLSRDFLLIVGLCIGIACFAVILGRWFRMRMGGLDLEGQVL